METRKTNMDKPKKFGTGILATLLQIVVVGIVLIVLTIFEFRRSRQWQ